MHGLRHAPGGGIALNLLIPIVENFSDPLGKVPVLHEPFRHGHDIRVQLAEICGDIPQAQSIWPLSAHERGSRWVAEGLLAKIAREHRAAGGKPIEVRRLRHWIAVATEAVVEVVEDHEEDVGFLLGRVSGMQDRKRSEQKGGESRPKGDSLPS
jgi:hypothetical protein